MASKPSFKSLRFPRRPRGQAESTSSGRDFDEITDNEAGDDESMQDVHQQDPDLYTHPLRALEVNESPSKAVSRQLPSPRPRLSPRPMSRKAALERSGRVASRSESSQKHVLDFSQTLSEDQSSPPVSTYETSESQRIIGINRQHMKGLSTSARQIQTKQTMRANLDKIATGQNLKDDEFIIADELEDIFEASQAEFLRDAEIEKNFVQGITSSVESDIGDKDEADLPSTMTSAIGRSTYDLYSDKLIAAFEINIDHLVQVALGLDGMPCDVWVARRKSGTTHYRNFICDLVMMILGADSLVLEHFVRGHLPQEAVANRALEKRLRLLRKSGNPEKRPTIYAQYLVDKNGVSPTPAELLQALEITERYAKSAGGNDNAADLEASRIDTQFGRMARSVNNTRRYLEGPSQVKTTLEFVKSTRSRLRTLPLDAPLKRPLSEVGYASRPERRLSDHAHHSSSDYIMNLTEAIFRYMKPKYFIKQYVVMELVHHTHAMYAEILFSRFGLAYSYQGGGFSHCAAGMSHSGSEKMEKDYWALAQQRLHASPEFRQAIEKEIESSMSLEDMFTDIKLSAEIQDEQIKILRLLEFTPAEIERKVTEVSASISTLNDFYRKICTVLDAVAEEPCSTE